MQIRIEIDVKPDELRRFLGIPDVSGLSDDLVQLSRNLLESASGRLDPTVLLKANLDVVRNNPTLRRIWLGAAPESGPVGPECETALDPEAPTPRKRRRRKPST